MIDQSTPHGRIVAAALRLAGERPWGEVTYFDIAAAAGLNLAELRREFRSKPDILAAFARMVDDHILTRASKPAASLAPRDRLFEVVMSRFDALAAYKGALRSFARAGESGPALARAMLTSQTWMLRAAEIPTEGIAGTARAAGLATIYASVFRTWLADDDPGMARTMAALDRRLRRGERTWSSIEQAIAAGDRVVSIFKPWRARPEAASSRPADDTPPRPPESPAPAV